MREFVLDKGHVTLIDKMGGDLSVVNAARVSFGKKSISMEEREEKLLSYLYENGHTSPFRHAFVKLHIKAPIFVMRQWMKHQVGCSWNEKSARYSKMKNDFYIPTYWRGKHESNLQGSSGLIENQDEASASYILASEQSITTYNALLGRGVCREQARMILPISLYTESVWTASLQALMHFLRERESNNAQYEIQEYARAVRRLCSPVFPMCFKLT